MQIRHAKYYRFLDNLRGYKEGKYNEFIDLFMDRLKDNTKQFLKKQRVRGESTAVT